MSCESFLHLLSLIFLSKMECFNLEETATYKNIMLESSCYSGQYLAASPFSQMLETQSESLSDKLPGARISHLGSEFTLKGVLVATNPAPYPLYTAFLGIRRFVL